jgi:hypothetical protein
MFSPAERDRIREELLARAEADGAITGAAFTGSLATGEEDRWSDTDLVLAVRGEVDPVLDRWTRWLYDDLKAVHHWDLQAGAKIIRVFLLPGWIELDVTFAPETHFGPLGPQWRTTFGHPQQLEPHRPADVRQQAGLLWHHALHAHVCIERGRWWQAEHWISAMREHTIGMACARLDYPVAYAKGAHLLPDDLTAPLEATLVRSLTEPELRRALAAAVDVTADVIAQSDAALAIRLRPMLAELARPA